MSGNSLKWSQGLLTITADTSTDDTSYAPEEVWSIPVISLGKSYLTVSLESVTQSGRQGIRVVNSETLPGTPSTVWKLEYTGYQGSIPDPLIWNSVPLENSILNHLIIEPIPSAYYRFRLVATESGKSPFYYAEATVSTGNDANYQNIQTLLTSLSDITADGKLTANEKVFMVSWWTNAQNEKTDLDNKASALTVSASAYDGAYNALSAVAATTWQAAGTTDISALSPTLYTLWANYWTERTKLQNAVTSQVNTNLVAAQGQLTDILADGKLTPNEKAIMVSWWSTAVGEKTDLDNKASLVAVSASAYDATYSALSAQAAGTWQAGGTTDVSGMSPSLYTLWSNYWTERIKLQNAVSAKLNTNITDALQQLLNIASNSILDKGTEKLSIISRYNTAVADKDALIKKAQAFSIGYTNLSNAFGALESYLNGLSPVYTDTTVDTPIDPTVWLATWNTFDTERAKLSTSLQGLTQMLNAAVVANITVTSTSTTAFDGYTVANGNKILLAGQTTTSENGIYSTAVTTGSSGATRLFPSNGDASGSGSYTSDSSAYDNNTGTSATLYSPDNGTETVIYSGFSGANTAGTLSVNITASFYSEGPTPSAAVYYSTDGGVNYTLFTGGSITADSSATLTASVSGISLSNLRIKVSATGITRKIKTWDLGGYVWDITVSNAIVAIKEVYIDASAISTGVVTLNKIAEVSDGETYLINNGNTYSGKNVTIVRPTTNGAITLTSSTPAFQAVLPTYGSAPVKILQNSSGVISWTDPPTGTGTVTSVSGTGTVSGLTLSGTVTNSGSLTLGGSITGFQPTLSGTGFIKASGTTISYDSSTYLTSISSGNVTTALGFTPYNSTNPSGFITSAGTSAACSGNAATASNSTLFGSLGTGSFFKKDTDFPNNRIHSSDGTTADTPFTGCTFSYAAGSPWVGPIASFGGLGSNSYALQINASYIGGSNFSFRTRNGDAGTWNSWKELIHTGNIGSQSVAYASQANYLTGHAAGYAYADGGTSSACSGNAGSATISSYTYGLGGTCDSCRPNQGIQTFYQWGGTNNAGNMPNATTAYLNGFTVAAHPSDPNYGFQMVQNMWDDELWFRRLTSSGGWAGFRKVIDSGNIGNQWVDHATTAGSANSASSAGTVTSLSGHNISELINNSGYVTSSGTVANATNAVNATNSTFTATMTTTQAGASYYFVGLINSIGASSSLYGDAPLIYNPTTNVLLTDGYEATGSGTAGGIILRNPSGTRFRLSVNSSNQLQLDAI